MRMRRTLLTTICLITLIFLPLQVVLSQTPSNSFPIDVLRDTDYLIIFIPGNQPVSLQNVEVEVEVGQTAVPYYFDSKLYPAFSGLNFTSLQTPLCIGWSKIQATLPSQCQGLPIANINVAPLTQANIAWYNPTLGQSYPVVILSNGNLPSRCTQSYCPNISIPVPVVLTPTSTQSPLAVTTTPSILTSTPSFTLNPKPTSSLTPTPFSLSSCDEASVQAALAKNASVKFTASCTMNLTTPISIKEDTQIDGNGKITISGNDKVQLFTSMRQV